MGERRMRGAATVVEADIAGVPPPTNEGMGEVKIDDRRLQCGIDGRVGMGWIGTAMHVPYTPNIIAALDELDAIKVPLLFTELD